MIKTNIFQKKEPAKLDLDFFSSAELFQFPGYMRFLKDALLILIESYSYFLHCNASPPRISILKDNCLLNIDRFINIYN